MIRVVKRLWFLGIAALALSGCSSPLSKLDVRIYPGAKVKDSQIKDGVVGATLESSDPPDKVTQFYEAEIGATASQGDLAGIKDGHQVEITVSDAGGGKTAFTILERKE